MIYAVHDLRSAPLPSHLTHPFQAFADATGYDPAQHTYEYPLVGVLELEQHEASAAAFPFFVTQRAFLPPPADPLALRENTLFPAARVTLPHARNDAPDAIRAGVLLPHYTKARVEPLPRAAWLAVEKMTPRVKPSGMEKKKGKKEPQQEEDGTDIVTLDPTTLLPVCRPHWIAYPTAAPSKRNSGPSAAERLLKLTGTRSAAHPHPALGRANFIYGLEPFLQGQHYDAHAPVHVAPMQLAAFNLYALGHLDGHENERSMRAHDPQLLSGKPPLHLSPAYTMPFTDLDRCPQAPFILRHDSRVTRPTPVDTAVSDRAEYENKRYQKEAQEISPVTGEPKIPRPKELLNPVVLRSLLEYASRGLLGQDGLGNFVPSTRMGPEGNAEWARYRDAVIIFLHEYGDPHSPGYVMPGNRPPNERPFYEDCAAAFDAWRVAQAIADNHRRTRGTGPRAKASAAKRAETETKLAHTTDLARRRPNGTSDFGRAYTFPVHPVQWLIPALTQLASFASLAHHPLDLWFEKDSSFDQLTSALTDAPAYVTFTGPDCSDAVKLRYVFASVKRFLEGLPAENRHNAFEAIVGMIKTATTPNPSDPHAAQPVQDRLLELLRVMCPDVLTPATLPPVDAIPYDSRVWLAAIWQVHALPEDAGSCSITPRNHVIRASRRKNYYGKDPYTYSADDQRLPATFEEALARA